MNSSPQILIAFSRFWKLALHPSGSQCYGSSKGMEVLPWVTRKVFWKGKKYVMLGMAPVSGDFMLGMCPPCLATQGTQIGLRDQIESSGRQQARCTDCSPRETLKVLRESSLTGTWLWKQKAEWKPGGNLLPGCFLSRWVRILTVWPGKLGPVAGDSAPCSQL